jgi:hypothetical protein
MKLKDLKESITNGAVSWDDAVYSDESYLQSRLLILYKTEQN